MKEKTESVQVKVKLLRAFVGLSRSYIVAEQSLPTGAGMPGCSRRVAVSVGSSKAVAVEDEASEGEDVIEDESVVDAVEKWSTASKGGRKSVLVSSAGALNSASSNRWWLQGDGGSSGTGKVTSVTRGRKALEGGHARGSGGRFRLGRSALWATSKSQSTGECFGKTTTDE